jgi:hypothetical protein
MGTLSETEANWLASRRGSEPLVVLMHHFPGDVTPFRWHGHAASPLVPRWFGDVFVTVQMHIPDDERDRFWEAARKAGVVAVLCGHVHRARLGRHAEIAIGLNGESGAAWAGRTIAYYRIDGSTVTAEYEAAAGAATSP